MRVLRWIGIFLGSLAGLVIIAYAVVYVLSERVLQRTYDIPVDAISIPADAASIVEGRRLAIIHGCFDGCHGRLAEGVIFLDDPMLGILNAPNLTAAVRKYSSSQLTVIIRHGLRPDGRSMLVMPSEGFIALNDRDLGCILAFLKNLPAVDGPGPRFTPGPIARIGLAIGKFKTAAQFIAETAPPPDANSDEAAYGRYLARTTCPQCHGADLRGTSNPEFTSPDLRVVAAYSPEAFTLLLRQGTALGGRKVATMGAWARDHFSHYTDAEIAALYSYLHTMPEAPHG